MELETFREETRDWLESNCPQEMRLGAIHFEGAYELYRTDAAIEWRDRALTRGWTAPTWPTEYGGGGWMRHTKKCSQKKWLALRHCLPRRAWVWR